MVFTAFSLADHAVLSIYLLVPSKSQRATNTRENRPYKTPMSFRPLKHRNINIKVKVRSPVCATLFLWHSSKNPLSNTLAQYSFPAFEMEAYFLFLDIHNIMLWHKFAAITELPHIKLPPRPGSRRILSLPPYE